MLLRGGKSGFFLVGLILVTTVLIAAVAQPAMAEPGDSDVTFYLRIDWEDFLGFEHTLFDQTQNLDAGRYYSVAYNIDQGVTVNVQVQLTSGSGVNFFTFDSADYADFEAYVDDPSGNFQYYISGSGFDIMSKSFSFTAPWDGVYYFVVDNTGAYSTGSDEFDSAFLGLMVIAGIVVVVVLAVVVLAVASGRERGPPQPRPPTAYPPAHAPQQTHPQQAYGQAPSGAGRCPACGATLKPTDKFCSSCGRHSGNSFR